MKIWIGIDNGTTGSVGWVNSSGAHGLHRMPTKDGLNYQKKGQMITRIDMPALVQHLGIVLTRDDTSYILSEVTVIVERPFTMAYLTPAVANGMRAFEAVLIALELQQLPYQIVDSKQWQKPMLGTDLKGSDVLKRASLAKGKQLWPALNWKGWKDADGLLIAEWARTKTPF